MKYQKRYSHILFLWSLVASLLATRGMAATRLPVSGKKGMVVSTSDLASAIGAQVLRDGGNAVDAAVAVGFALAVTWPQAGNVGGGGFALVRLPKGEAYFVDYREVAPKAAAENFFLDPQGNPIPQASTVGYRASGVPGTPAGLELMHKRWGRLPWHRLIEPARLLAAKGYRLNQHHIKALRNEKKLLMSLPEARSIFFPGDQEPQVGDLFIQRDLARSLRALQKEGAAAFYRGSIAQLLVKDQADHGGSITSGDLATYKVEVREPLRGTFQGLDVLTAPPPSSGGATLLQMLTMLGQDDLRAMGVGSSRYQHLLVEAMKRAFADRSEWYADPAFSPVPLKQLLSPILLKQRREDISLTRASRSEDIKPLFLMPEEKLETTHFTVMDQEGLTVSNTYTLNGNFGSGVVAKGTGILLNNEMDDFTVKPGVPNLFGLIQSTRNKIAGGKRPLSSMTPTIFVQGGQPILAVGSPGGPTIINTVLQVSLNVLVHGFDVQAAVDEPRIHHQWLPDAIVWEPRGLNQDSRSLMEQMGHVFAKEPRFLGDANAISFDPKQHKWSGGADSRWGGAAIAP